MRRWVGHRPHVWQRPEGRWLLPGVAITLQFHCATTDAAGPELQIQLQVSRPGVLGTERPGSVLEDLHLTSADDKEVYP